MDADTVSELADAVLDRLLAGDEPRLRTLRRQRERADRDVSVTGVGLFVEFEVPGDCEVLPGEPDDEMYGVEVRMDDLDHGLGFVLFVRDGRLSLLEGYTYGEPLPDTARSVRVVETGDGADTNASDDG